MAKHVVAKLADIPPGSRKIVTVEGREIGIFNIKGELFAVLNRCPHEGASLCNGTLIGLMTADGPGQYKFSREGEILRCPWHGWEFDIRTGKSCADPQRVRIRSYEVRVESGREEPTELTATTFPVSVDDADVVIEA